REPAVEVEVQHERLQRGRTVGHVLERDRLADLAAAREVQQRAAVLVDRQCDVGHARMISRRAVVWRVSWSSSTHSTSVWRPPPAGPQTTVGTPAASQRADSIQYG